MYLHFSHPRNVDAILSDGLRNDLGPDGSHGLDWVLPFYDEDPVYLATEGAEFIEVYEDGPWSEYACFEVDVRGLSLAADLPSLVDKGARYADGMMFVGRRAALEPLLQFADADGWIEIEQLVDPETDAARAAIKITGTAACLVPVDAERIRLRAAYPKP